MTAAAIGRGEAWPRKGWPVSTTHALLGGIVGAALVMAGPAGLRLTAVANKALLPLLLSPLCAIVLCWGLLSTARWVARRVPAWRPGCCDPAAWRRDPDSNPCRWRMDRPLKRLVIGEDHETRRHLASAFHADRGAFAWDVLDKLVEDGRLEIDGLSATSAGSMNAAVYAYGKMTGGPDGARRPCTILAQHQPGGADV